MFIINLVMYDNQLKPNNLHFTELNTLTYIIKFSLIIMISSSIEIVWIEFALSMSLLYAVRKLKSLLTW